MTEDTIADPHCAEIQELKLQRRDLRRLVDYMEAEVTQGKERKRVAEVEERSAREEARIAKEEVARLQKTCADNEQMSALLEQRDDDIERLKEMLRVSAEEREKERTNRAMEKWAYEAEIGSRKSKEEAAYEELAESREAVAGLEERTKVLTEELRLVTEQLHLKEGEVQTVRNELQSDKEALQSARNGLQAKGEELQSKKSELQETRDNLGWMKGEAFRLKSTIIKLVEESKLQKASHSGTVRELIQRMGSVEAEKESLSPEVLMAIKREETEQYLSSAQIKRALEQDDESDSGTAGPVTRSSQRKRRRTAVGTADV